MPGLMLREQQKRTQVIETGDKTYSIYVDKSSDFSQCQEHTLEKRQSFTQMILGIVDIHM